MIVRQPEDEEETEQRQEVQQQDVSKLKAKKEVTIQDTIFNLQGGKKQLFKRCKTPQFEMNFFFESILSLLIILVKASNVKLTMTMINNDKRYS